MHTWIGLDLIVANGRRNFMLWMDGPSRQSKNESCLTVTYLILLDVNSKTSVMYFKGRLISVFESILLVFMNVQP